MGNKAVKKIISIPIFHKSHAFKSSKGMTLMELIVSMGISAVLITVIVFFCANISIQYGKQKLDLENSAKILYLMQIFNSAGSLPEVYVKSDGKELKITDNYSNPVKETIYYEEQGSIYKDEYENSVYKNTILLSSNCTVNFMFQSDASYLKDILKIAITDNCGQKWIREVSVRDCDITGIY